MADDRRTLLLVDDEEENLIVLSALLDRNYRIFTADGASKALEILDAEAVDVLITDQRMPGTSGVELVNEARLRHPDVVRIVLTAYTDVDVMLDAVNQGSVYGYVIKPWNVDHMRATIRQAAEWAVVRRQHGELAAELSRANRRLAERNAELEKVRQHLLVKEKLAAVGRFAAEMVHEMSNHLQIIDVIAQILATEQLGDEADESVRQLREQTEQLVHIVHDIRQFSSGARLEPRMSATRPHELVEQVVGMCRRLPKLRHVSVLVDAADVGTWWLDRPKMIHLLTNLVRNGMQATPSGGEVHVALKTDGDQLVFVIDDGGSGVPEEDRERVFEPFFSTKGSEGTGLGLTICKWVAEMHGGAIEVGAGRGGRGARFTVVLPRAGEPSAVLG